MEKTMLASNAKVLHYYEEISPREEDKVIKFFKDLAPSVSGIIDLPLIITEGFPKFEEILGSSDWRKVKKFYGIGESKACKGLQFADISLMLSKLRSIENAQYYLHGYREMLEDIALRLCHCPDDMDYITKAKILRLYIFIFKSLHFFLEDYPYNEHLKGIVLSRQLMAQNNKQVILPEELGYLYRVTLLAYSNGSIFYDKIKAELDKLQKRDLKVLLDFAELKVENGTLVSIPAPTRSYTFGQIRTIKYRLFEKPNAQEMDFFFCSDLITDKDACDFAVMYKMYKLLQSHALEEFEIEEVASAYCVGANVVDKKFQFYKLFKDSYVGGEAEANRVLELIDYCAANDIHLPTKLEDGTDATVDVRDFLAYLDFAKAEGYIAKESEDDLKRYFAFMQVPAFEDNLKLFEAGTISSTELKAMCNISEEFEASLGIERKKDPFDIAKKFALAHHYIEKEDDLSNQLLQDVIVSGAEDIWLGYDSHAISEEKLLRKFGFELGIIPPNYFFVSTAIDTAQLEKVLLDIKSRRLKGKELSRYSYVIKLYCYLVDNQVPCGPKGKVSKGNKHIKTANLRALIA